MALTKCFLKSTFISTILLEWGGIMGESDLVHFYTQCFKQNDIKYNFMFEDITKWTADKNILS